MSFFIEKLYLQALEISSSGNNFVNLVETSLWNN